MQADALLAPVAGPSPCGEDMSFSVEFDQITEMRREDDPTLNQGEWVTTLKTADWPGVTRACTELLTQRTKDLRLAMWLTEAWAMTRQYEGLAQGLSLCTQLCERFWTDLHPQADGSDHEQRVGNLSWLLQRVVTLADTRTVTRGRQGEALSLRDLTVARQAQAHASRSPHDAEPKGDAALSVEQFNRIAKETPASQWRAQCDAVRDCLNQLLTLQQVVDGHLGADGPGFVQAKEAISKASHEIERLAREAGALHNDAPTANPASSPVAMTHTPAPAQAPEASSMGPLQNRAQALAQLQAVADFFRRTEPHSPVAYLAEKAVKWGEMPLHEWLSKVIKDPGAMSHLQELLGIDEAGANGAH
jgi:type VI secretion system protein ImpA